MKNVFMLAVGLLAVLFLAGCGKSAESDSYYPLTLGSTWTYRTTEYESLPGKNKSNPAGKHTIRAAYKDKLANGEEATAMVTTADLHVPGYRPLVDTKYVRVTNGYVVQYRKKTSVVADTLCALPPGPGKTWHRLVVPGLAFKNAFVGQEDIRAGTAEYKAAWRAEEDLVFSRYHGYGTRWYARGVGLVKDRLVVPSSDSTKAVGVTLYELVRARIR